MGLIVLLPSTWLPRRAVAVGGVVALSVALFVFGGGTLSIPGMFLIGSALVWYGVIARIEHSTRGALALFGLFAAVAVPA